jgi:hypothetical protein
MSLEDGDYPGEIPEAVRATIPNFNVPTMINKNYTLDQEGQDIRDEDVVRPRNHLWARTDEIKTMKVLSADRCPTYGSCVRCFRSGPYGRLCSNCNEDNVTLQKNGLHYVILMKRSERGATAVLDSITLSMIFRAGHETARADREIRWLKTPLRWYDDTMLDRYLHRVFRQEIHEDNRASRAEHRRILHEVGDATDFDD